jgi:hypothetical protein
MKSETLPLGSQLGRVPTGLRATSRLTRREAHGATAALRINTGVQVALFGASC